jgi:pimeloyl-ACP methyl ester carboxylesterase
MSLSRRDIVGGTLALAALSTSQMPSPAAPQDTAIRPFRIELPDAELADLRRRLAASRLPDRETVGDGSQGVRLKALEDLIGEWRDRYDWRDFERRFNALPQFMTRIDGVDIQFIHVRSRHEGALPLILTHGWPGSMIEFMKVIGPLSDPAAHAGRAEEAFHLVIPSIPGHGFSGKPDSPGWGPDRVARAWAELMRRLGYDRYVSQGGDHGSVISDAMARLKLPGLLAIHVNMPATVPAEIAEALKRGGSLPEGLPADEQAAFRQLDAFYRTGAAYAGMMSTRPQTLGYALSDSPAGLAAFFYEKFAAWTYSGGVPERSLTRTDMLDDMSLYWLTNTATSAARFYWENNANNFNAVDIDLPTAITVFPGEIYRAPRRWAERAYRKLIYWSEVDRGGHFAAWEEPDLFASEIRAAFRSLR